MSVAGEEAGAPRERAPIVRGDVRVFLDIVIGGRACHCPRYWQQSLFPENQDWGCVVVECAARCCHGA